MKFNKRILSNLFKHKNKNFKSDINIPIEIDTKLLSAYPDTKDELIIKSTPIIIGYKVSSIDEKYLSQVYDFLEALSKVNMKFIVSAKEGHNLIVSGLSEQYDRLVSLIALTNINNYESNAFINATKECISILWEDLFPITKREIGLNCTGVYEPGVIHDLRNCNSVGIAFESDPAALSILHMQKINEIDIKSTGLFQKDVLSLCNMVFIVRGDIAESYLFNKAVYLFDLSEINSLNGYFVCSMSIYDFMTSDLIKDPEVNKIVVSTINTFQGYFSVYEKDDKGNLIGYNILKNRAKLGLIISNKDIEEIDNDSFYEDIDEDVEG